MRILLACILMLLPVSVAGQPTDADAMRVVYNETREFNFTNSVTPDLLSLQVISGERCESTLMVYTVRRAADHFPIFSETRALSFYINNGDLEVFSDCPAAIALGAEDFWQLHKKAVFTDPLSWIPEHANHTVYGDDDVKQRAQGAQLICMSGYEAQFCSWFDPEAGGFKQLLDFGF